LDMARCRGRHCDVRVLESDVALEIVVAGVYFVAEFTGKGHRVLCLFMTLEITLACECKLAGGGESQVDLLHWCKEDLPRRGSATLEWTIVEMLVPDMIIQQMKTLPRRVFIGIIVWIGASCCSVETAVANEAPAIALYRFDQFRCEERRGDD